MKCERYRCDLCSDWCEAQWARGFYESEPCIGVLLRNPSETEQHICRDCMESIALDLRALKKAEREAKKK